MHVSISSSSSVPECPISRLLVLAQSQSLPLLFPLLFLRYCLLLLLSPAAQGECGGFASPQALLDYCSQALPTAAGPPQPQAGPLGELTVLLVGGRDLESELQIPSQQGLEA